MGWTDELRMQLIAHNGSVQQLNLPSDVKELYKTVWEIKQRIVLDMAADRGAYIDQSQSLNIHMVDATTAKLSSMHFHGWQLGLKTGMYYLRTKAAADAIKFTVDVDKVRRSSTASLPEGMQTPASKGTEKEAIDRLKAGEPKYSCVGCSAEGLLRSRFVWGFQAHTLFVHVNFSFSLAERGIINLGVR